MSAITVAPAIAEALGLGIRCREDLSFTRREGRSDESSGLLNNWYSPHSMDDYWHEGQDVGHRRFREVMTLALHDETAAAQAIRFAITAQGWKGGWGEEDGFAHALAQVVIVGIRALVSGAEPFIERETSFDVEEPNADTAQLDRAA
jgi:hypothetical protein